ncbi:MAG: tetratricopeptide repeat protein [Saprospiraceae bacterium]|nr:tetratricopeptide repeat protein [Saprospiraceae bacterium]MBK8371858.1 tetratricopeptide repeat protein [Saprospiraceae bacterium]MBK8547125.1 tetratricopeptide repeat protein [Saprospiraceae bacterium]MBK9042117.1 tetratricopeptide repeat protein [Saprospiraceae bacterium]MBP6694169.1 tetratricopeptide repeat protein [Saprospiraceae bacterium]
MKNYFVLLTFLFCILGGCKETKSPAPENNSGFPEIESLSKEIAENPKNPDLYMQRAKFFYEKKVYNNAAADVEKALALDSLNPIYYHFLADCYLDGGDGQKSLKTMYKVLTLYPERIQSLLKTAEIHYILEDYDSSILAINEAVKVDPQNAECYFMLGVNFRALKDIPRAINSFQTAVEMDSKLTDAWIILGELLEKNKDPKALKYYESGVLSNPTSAEAKHALAYYLQNHKNIPKALDLYKEIILNQKDYIDAYLNSGILYLEMDSLNKAYEHFNIMTGIQPQNAKGYYFRGLVQKKKGKIKEALLDFQTAGNLDSDNPEIQKALEELKQK